MLGISVALAEVDITTKDSSIDGMQCGSFSVIHKANEYHKHLHNTTQLQL